MEAVRTCKACESSFQIAATSSNEFCSVSCRYASRRKFKNCEHCGHQYKSRPNSRYCSKICGGLARQKRSKFVCNHCGQSYQDLTSSESIYCSPRCHDLARQKWQPCEYCKKPYRAGQSGYRDNQYCSNRCSKLAQGILVVKQCEGCGKSFDVPRCLANRKSYCSRACLKSRQYHFNCEVCGGLKVVPACQRARARFCSHTCRAISIVRQAALKTPTSIEVETYEALQSLGIDFEPQYRIGKYLADAFIASRNLVIECQGDFYHCNPVKYPEGPQHDIQRRRIEVDKQKFAEYEKQGYQHIELWELDIKQHGAKSLLEKALSI